MSQDKELPDRNPAESNVQPGRQNNAPQRKKKFGCLRMLLVLGILLGVAGFALYKYCIEMPGNGRPVVAGGQPATESGTASSATATQESALSENDVPDENEQSADKKLSVELEEYVTVLASDIGVRNIRHIEKLNESADWIQSQFESWGYSVERQTFQVNGVDCHNLIVEKTGASLADEIIIVGAHYDTYSDTPGANDNGSGTASMLALARAFANEPVARTLRFVAFTNEEPPYFQREDRMGSWVYARQCRKNDDDIKGVLSLETMGYFSDEPDSQQYPPPLNLMYPDTGNFIGFVGDLRSRELLHRVIETFRETSTVASEGASLPSQTPGVGWSDHWSFWQEEYAGIMVTDTAPFRYPHYHETTDTVDKIDFETLAAVVEGLKPVVSDLVND